ncbi:MAG: phytoene synthase [Candidatus Liberibacter europaeus]|uniref:Phytoene synthase n=1 Tax=Candidatus Liberibacter europaeus TaxID=744859 RepID=A0A2T4VX54_9HYPH|nr:phytoene synthase [Candidatus Liberibacter europaeus]PTL86359.1 MAG: phytoene synthase [Candidatus Liberibacter europaeus]
MRNNHAIHDQLFYLHNLRDVDRDRYLSCLLSPSNVRISLAILYGFNAELMRVRELTSNPFTGEMRLQWWKNIFESFDKDISPQSASPLADGICYIICKYDLPYQRFLDMIESRFFDLYNESMYDCTQLEDYSFKVSSNLIHLAVRVLDNQQYFCIPELIKHAGIAQVVGELILLLSKHISRGQLYLPLDILGAAGLDRETFLSGEDREKISVAIKIFAEWGLEHLLKARKESSNISPNIFPAFIPISMTGNILENAINNGIKIFDHPYKVHQWIRQWQMLSSSIKRRF